ncbi:glycosyltransferase family 2 protein [Mucilaginibacter lappiensis]|uniref:Glycosyltransferase involved in cell wall biosynthesis n=1 Tax=Mucilaginibacter lappiensis TaxID=354630 RepID=A0A841JEK0_9SPHI|nr:glycosyltransferase family 2 protein [Mucilaginibacter lappiensis]MBB6127048.1 glycosyltransferase involved in cell wall biosynthesis [Mucilaginibacter lappiensis]
MQNVSVCMATYNGERYILQQVESILNQLDADDELIVSDDGSTDRTLDILNEFTDKRIKIFSNKNQKGPVGNFENAIRNSNGQYIFLADQDDVWFDTKIKVMVSYLQRYDVVNCDCKVVDDSLNVICPSYFQYISSGVGFIKNLKTNTYMGNCMAFKRNTLDVVLPFPKNIPNHDLWIGAVADLFYKPYFIPEVLGLHRRHDHNASNTFDIKLKTSFWQKINKRLILFSHLPRLFGRYIYNKTKR